MISKNKIAALEGLAHLDHHFAAERTVWLVYAGSIDEDDLPAGSWPLLLRQVDDSLNSIASGLRLGRDNRQLLADERIEQRGLASVRAAEDANKTGAKGIIESFRTRLGIG